MSQLKLSCHNCIEPFDDCLFIECADCTPTVSAFPDEGPSTSSKKVLRLCLDCFTLGAELGSHKRTHRYYVKGTGNEGLTLFSGELLNGDGKPWLAREELGLLDGIERFNLGNWEDVANHYVKSSDPSDIKRSTREILEHYDKFYLHGSVGRVTVDCLKRPRDRDHTAPLSVVTDSEPNEGSCAALKILPSPPMKEAMRKISSDDFRLLAYMPQRDDFEKEHNNEVEALISNLMILPDDDDLDKAVKAAQIEMYVREVAERRRRKVVARDYDLVAAFLKHEKSCSKATYSYSVPEQKKLKMERELKEQLKKFAQFVPSTEFDELIADIIKERTLKERIKELQDYRRDGVTTLEGEMHLKENASLTSRRQSDDEGVEECDIPTQPKKKSIDGNECASGKNAWPKHLDDGFSLKSTLSGPETVLCDEHSISCEDYVLLKAALLKEQAAKAEGVPFRPGGTGIGGGGGGSTDDILELKVVVKDFMKRCGWIPYFSS